MRRWRKGCEGGGEGGGEERRWGGGGGGGEEEEQEEHPDLLACRPCGRRRWWRWWWRWWWNCWMTNLQIENCLKDYPAAVCCADELPSHVGVRPRTFIVNTDTCDRGGMDDLMSTAAKDPRINDLFTEGSHHRNLTVIALNQNLYFAKPPPLPPPLTPSPPPPQVDLQHSFTLMAAVVVAEVVAMVVVVAEVDIHDCLYVYIGDGGGPTRSSSIRTRATMAEVTGYFPLVGSVEFVDSLGNAPETYHRRFANANGP